MTLPSEEGKKRWRVKETGRRLVIDAVDSATWYTHMGIETAEEIGSGHGPLNHLHSTTKILIPRSVSCQKTHKKIL